MPYFTNGLEQIETTLTSGAPGADNALTAVNKINSNFQKTAVLGGNWLGAGLAWQNNRLVVANRAGSILVGDSTYELSNEFRLVAGALSIDRISVSKLVGGISTGNISLANGQILIGGTSGLGRAIDINPNNFSLAGDVFSIRPPENNSLAANKLNLPLNSIPVGNSNSGASAVTLGSMFSVTNGVLNVTVPSTTSYTGIQTQNFLGANPKILVSSDDANQNKVLSWQTASTLISSLIDDKLNRESNSKELHVDPINGDDALTNRGRSIFTPFKTIQRACLEVARSSYTVSGANATGDTVIYITVGRLSVDNRPGSNSVSVSSTPALENLVTNNGLNYFNSANGGVIVPRGCSIIGVDPRRTVFTPIYVPDPSTTSQTTAIFRLTGNAFACQFSVQDGSPNYSHHLVRAFEAVSLNDLNLYYDKVYAAFAALDGLTTDNLNPVESESQIVTDPSNTNVDSNGFKIVDSVKASSAYIFNVSLRSRFGMCGLFLDGNVVTGIKSMVTAQFTNVSLQVDPQAFVPDNNNPIDGKQYRADYRHFAFKVTNNAYAQIVSCFVIGNAVHYWVANGGEMSITNSCSNFGGVALYSESSATESLIQDRGYGGVRVLPPLAIARDVRELIVGSLDADGTTASVLKLNQFLSNADIKYVNNSYLYVRIPDRVNPSNTLDLQAKLVPSGAVFAEVSNQSTFNTIDSPGTETENSIYQYLNCIGNYEFASAWYNASSPPPGGFAAAKATEIALRKQLLENANVFVKRILENRTNADRSYHLFVSVPSTARAPQPSYVLTSAPLSASNTKYYVADVTPIDPSLLAGDNQCSTIPGNVYKVTLLRVNRPELAGEPATYPDLLEDLAPTPAYNNVLGALDPRLYPTDADLLAVSYDAAGVSRLAFEALLTQLGYSPAQVQALLTPTPAGSLPSRYKCLPTSGSLVVNSSFPFDLLRPSLIRCAGHTWEWVGYKNYSTALPRLQTKTLTQAQVLAALQTTVLGGRIYASGMDESGNLYTGRTVLNLATNSQQIIRFDGLQQQQAPSTPGSTNNQASSSQTFQDLNVTGTLTAAIGEINSLTLGQQTFQANSQFRVTNGASNLSLTEAATPPGIKANSQNQTYGLVRRATSAELTANSGEGYVSPADLLTVNAGFKGYTSGTVLPWASNKAIPSGWNLHAIDLGRPAEAWFSPVLFLNLGSTSPTASVPGGGTQQDYLTFRQVLRAQFDPSDFDAGFIALSGKANYTSMGLEGRLIVETTGTYNFRLRAYTLDKTTNTMVANLSSFVMINGSFLLPSATPSIGTSYRTASTALTAGQSYSIAFGSYGQAESNPEALLHYFTLEYKLSSDSWYQTLAYPNLQDNENGSTVRFSIIKT